MRVDHSERGQLQAQRDWQTMGTVSVPPPGHRCSRKMCRRLMGGEYTGSVALIYTAIRTEELSDSNHVSATCDREHVCMYLCLSCDRSELQMHMGWLRLVGSLKS